MRDRIETLLAHPHRLAILAGAGVSIPAPSALPSALEFLEMLFQDVSSDPRHQRLLTEAVAPQSGQRETVGDYLRFETVMHALAGTVDSELEILDVFSACRRVNAYHRFLAAQIARGVTVLTTNFDNLIEQACREAGVHYDLIATANDLESFLEAPIRFANPLIKLHGGRDLVYADGTILAGAHNLGATIVQVTRAGFSSGMGSRLANVIANVAAARHLLVIGYSGCDDLDVIPALLAAEPMRGLTWIVHSGSDRDVIDENALASAHRTVNGLLLDPHHRLHQQLLRRTTQPDLRFARWDAGALLGLDFTATQVSEDWRVRYRACRTKWLGDGPHAALLAQMFSVIEARGLAEEVLRLALAHDGDLPGDERAGLECMLADVLIAGGRHDAAADLLIDVIALPRQGLQGLRAVAYTLLARIQMADGRHQEAIPFLNTALAIAEEEGNTWAMCDALYEAGQVSVSLGTTEMGLKQLQQSTRASREIGDCFSMAMGHCAVGAALIKEGDYVQAGQELLQGITLAETIGARQVLLYGHHVRGLLAEREHDLPAARSEYLKSIQWARAAERFVDLSHSLNNLGNVCVEQHDYAMARRAFFESLRIKRRLGDELGLKTTLMNIANLHAQRGNLRQSMRAYRVAEQLGVR